MEREAPCVTGKVLRDNIQAITKPTIMGSLRDLLEILIRPPYETLSLSKWRTVAAMDVIYVPSRARAAPDSEVRLSAWTTTAHQSSEDLVR